jgi:hypothetical protein
VLGEILHIACTAPTSELAEREHDRDPAQYAASPVSLTVQPSHVTLDFGADPRCLDPIDRRGFDEVRLQHGNFLSG